MLQPPILMHLARALRAVVGRELNKFLRQPSRLASSLVRPLLWFVVFSAGFHNVFGVAIIAPYETYVDYKEYMLPGLLGMIALFNGMQSSLSMVYDREMGSMKTLLVSPLPRSFLLTSKLLAGVLISVIQAIVFLLIAAAYGIEIPALGFLTVLPALILSGLMLGALGLLLSSFIKQLENFAGVMNFVIFPMFFLSSALYPLWRIKESNPTLALLAGYNPFTAAVELIRFALYGQFNLQAALITLFSLLFFLGMAIWGYNPSKGMMSRRS